MDENSHMNVQFYVHVAEQGLSECLRRVGMGELYAAADKFGNFALEQHIRYYAEILTGDQVSVHVRVIDVIAKTLLHDGLFWSTIRASNWRRQWKWS